ncbi:putative inactive tyrosine-protein kinase Wsck [Phlebotomus argentipes]|uniref:putative inactive tyrosine-protein kinase Wsck n=1 Tax=Phlebotomus argentipes TaxID=94469 RepID=UPI0028935F50|nr:putative inactive tyrosine-protein kinase Wsck [Phlebotomus argentipes]
MRTMLLCVLMFGVLLAAAQENDGTVGCFKKSFRPIATNTHVGTATECAEKCREGFFKYAVVQSTSCSCSNTYPTDPAEKLDPGRCNIQCSKNKDEFCGGDDVESYYETNLSVPGPPKHLRMDLDTVKNTSFTILWEPPDASNFLMQYAITARVIHTFAHRMLVPIEWRAARTDVQQELVELHPATRYNISVTCLSATEEGGSAWIVAETRVGVPSQAPPEPKIMARDERTITVQINPIENGNGPITFYRVVVAFVNYGLVQNFDLALLKDYRGSREDGTQYYIAAELDLKNTSRLFRVGDGQNYRGFYNAPLPENSHVHIKIGVVSSLSGVTTYRYSDDSHDQHEGIILDTNADSEEDNSVMIAVLTVACIILGILLVGSVAMYFYLRKRVQSTRRRFTDVHELTLQGPIVEVENNGFIGDELDKGNFNEQLRMLLEKLGTSQKIPRNALSMEIDNILGTGRFGDVIQGRVNSVGDFHQCHIHVVSDDMEQHDQSLFLKEFDQVLRVTPHRSILNFLGVCQTSDWLYVIFEGCNVNLKKRLVDSRLPPNFDPRRMTSLSEEFVLRILCDVCDAMEYLSANKIVHRQLCAHNISLTTEDEPKLSIFGPTLFTEENKIIDLTRFQPPEVLKFQNYSSASDVWSFGCLMWECCTVGGTLFPSVPAVDLMGRLKNGVRPEQTPFLFDDLYQLMLNCWQLDSRERVTFTEIASNLHQMLATSPRHVLDFDRRDRVTLPYYLPLLEIKN